MGERGGRWRRTGPTWERDIGGEMREGERERRKERDGDVRLEKEEGKMRGERERV